MRKEALNGSPDYVSQIPGRNGGYQFPSLGEGNERTQLRVPAGPVGR